MFKGPQSKTREKNGSAKQSNVKKDLNKPNEQNQSNRLSKLLNYVPFHKARDKMGSPVSDSGYKISRDSSNIPRPAHVTSIVSDNISVTSSIMEIGSKTIMERLSKDFQDLRLEYQNTVLRLYKEHNGLKEEMKKNEKEIYNYIKIEYETLKKSMDQLDVEIRMVNKTIYNLQNHYVKFIPFLIENLLTMMKSQEYLVQRVTELEHLKANENKMFQSSTSSYCNTPSSNSFTYSISISPIEENDNYKLVFTPFDNICISKFSEEAQEQLYSIPVIENIFSNKTKPSNSPRMAPNNTPNRILLGSKTIPYYLKRINNTGNETFSRSTINKNQRTYNYNNTNINSMVKIKSSEDDFNCLLISPNKIGKFRDLKRRYLKLKLKGLNYYTYPCVNSPIIDNDFCRKIDVNYMLEGEIEQETEKYDSNDQLCQSDTDMFGEKFQIVSESTDDSTNYQCSKIELVEDTGDYENSFELIRKIWTTIDFMREHKLQTNNTGEVELIYELVLMEPWSGPSTDKSIFFLCAEWWRCHQY